MSQTRYILVVDDEPDMELLIRQRFRKAIATGEKVFQFAGNGTEALEKLLMHPEIELMLTDINMPVMNGLELLQACSDRQLPIKSIVVSAYTDIQNIRTAMNRGAFDFITKPIDFIDLETTVTKTFHAIDESKMAQDALVQRDQAVTEKEKAQSSERFKQQFLANMSHEIRTPMNSVIGITNLLLKTELSEQQHKYISMIQAASEQLMSIINDILDISKIEAGKMTFEKIDFNIRQVIENVRNMLIFKAQERNLELKLNVHPDIPNTLLGDPSKLAQILINLVGNSIKFTHEGFIEIKCDIKYISNTLCDIEFSVADTGIGIAQEKLSSIFESFTQANSDTSRKYGGTGLGLTICKQLAELQGGNIGLESKIGLGTRFYFNIPYEIGTANDHKSLSDSNLNRFKLTPSTRILLVEDNDFNKIVAEDTILEQYPGVQIEHASNGLEAVEMVTKYDYDIVLMDIQMPEMDGYEATRTIRALGNKKAQVRIMAMTANATPEEILKCFESGVNEYISKPFVPEELFEKLETQVAAGKC
ncbi:MAG: response regulator [Bacteroidota bacterium]